MIKESASGECFLRFEVLFFEFCLGFGIWGLGFPALGIAQ
jgi:hypothetical protein